MVPAFCIRGEGLSLSPISVLCKYVHGVYVVLSTAVVAGAEVVRDAAAALELTTACNKLLFVADDGKRLCLQSAQ